MPPRTSTVRPVILGLLWHAPRSGYEIKQAVDRSTRFFWAASYGQIYPELTRLEQEGLVSGAPDPHGRRRRTVYSLTPAGERALGEWLSDGGASSELRDLGLLRLFFADAGGPESVHSALRALRARHAGVLAQLVAVKEAWDESDTTEATARGKRLTLEYGIALNGSLVEWLEAAEATFEKPSGGGR